MQLRLIIREKGQLKMKKLPASEWRQFAETILDSNKKRILKGINAAGQIAKPLHPRYARIKKKIRRVTKPIRDMKLTGATLWSYQVIRAADGYIRCEPKTRIGRKRAWAAQFKGEQMIGFTPIEEAAVLKLARQMYGKNALIQWEKK